MNLDDVGRISALDKDGMLAKIEALPGQLENAWRLGADLPLPAWKDLRQVILCGMGGSAIGADLVAHYAQPSARAALHVWRGYDLPPWARGPETLVVACSHSGNTEETLTAFEAARANGTQIAAITTGGELAKRARGAGAVLWTFEHAGPPRAAVGFSFGLTLALLWRCGLVPDPSKEIEEAVAAMRSQQQAFGAAVPAVHNPAKRMGGQFMDRWPLLFGAGLTAPVARRWRTQMNELAKAGGSFEELPEANHNVVSGVVQPAGVAQRIMVVCLRAPLDDPRLVRRLDATRHIFMVEGFNTDAVDGVGDNRLAQQWTCLHYGDYAAFYLAMAYGLDPTPIPAIESLKDQLARG
ncbi:MAG TPA: bifunctional phosphoglucose/phosphomannose isomerase [Anaerolineales bacterium]|nr:bifunctional phosphoglucose/phosphomannose isomerase [Anaerolineales bacterium]